MDGPNKGSAREPKNRKNLQKGLDVRVQSQRRRVPKKETAMALEDEEMVAEAMAVVNA